MGNEFKLKKYYHVIQYSGLIASSFTILGILLFPVYFSFLGNPKITLLLFVSIWVVHLFSFLLQTVFRYQAIFTVVRFSWILFFILLFLSSGSIESPLFYLLAFPLLVAGINLNAKDVRIVAIIEILFLLSLFFFNIHTFPASSIAMHVFNVFNFTILCGFVYYMVKEKDVIHRDFDRLNELEHLKSDFITVASNRLRSPLTAASWALSELKEGGIDEIKKKELIDGGYDRIQAAITAVNELVHTIELDAYHLTVLPERLNISAVVKEIISELDYLIKQKEVKMSVTIPDVFTIRANPKMIKHALENIVNNAVSYSPKGEVSVMVTDKNQFCKIVVKDNGIGIPKEDLPLIFDRLYRGKEAMSLEPNRSGIGMYSAKRIVELHGGTISAESEKGKGTTVTFMIPML